MLQEEFQKEYQNLNQAQKQAVDTLYGPVMVVAGPWTGKTQIIALRTVNILLETKVQPSNILITTFTEAGVLAIKKRLQKFLGSEGYKVSVSTIHSFCQDVISTFPEKFLSYKASVAIDEIESLEILKMLIDRLYSQKKLEALVSDYDRYFYLRDIKSRISTLKSEWISLEAFRELIVIQEKTYQEELAEIKPTLKKYETTQKRHQTHLAKLSELALLYEAFGEYLKEMGKYDFSDMIQFVLEKFQTDEDLKFYYAEKYQFFMIDEFQDTNNAQNQIIRMILEVDIGDGSSEKNIMVVGDDDQSIYRFQGANIENMLDFSMQFPNTKFVVLTQNYRSTQQILDVCHTLISNNAERLSNRVEGISKKLQASNLRYQEGSEYSRNKAVPKLTVFQNQQAETSSILTRIETLIQSGKDPQEIAIIVRNNREVAYYTNILEKYQIPVASKQNADILKNEFVIFLLKYLKIIHDPDQFEALMLDVMRSDVVSCLQSDVFHLTRALYQKNYSKKWRTTVFEALQEIENLEAPFVSRERLRAFRDGIYEAKAKLAEMSFLDFFSHFLDQIGIISYIQTKASFDDIEDIYSLFAMIKSSIASNKNLNLEQFLAKIDLYELYGFSIPRQILKKARSGVQVLTAHASKWLEYEIVFIPWLYHKNWDNKRVVDRLKLPSGIAGNGLQTSENPLEEERRLFFVACSRSKEALYLSFPESIEGKLKLQSSFLPEIQSQIEEVPIVSQTINAEIQSLIFAELKPKLVIYTQAEYDYIDEFFETYRLSASDLNTFLEDPRKFLQNVVFKYPFVDNDATIFGKVYHRVLELFYARYKQNGKLDDVGYLTWTFESLLGKEMLSNHSYEKLLKKGKAGLEGFYREYASKPTEIVYLEYNFRPKGLSYEGVPLTGKIDKIEKSGFDLSLHAWEWAQMSFLREQITIVDYKTWKPKTLSEIKGLDREGNKKPWEGRYFRQLQFYKLMCELDHDFSSQFAVSKLALDFVEWRDGVYSYVEVEVSSDEYEDFKQEVTLARRQMIDRDFWKQVLENMSTEENSFEESEWESA